MLSLSSPLLLGAITLIGVGGLLLSPKAKTLESFYSGIGEQGKKPNLWTLTLSQVTTWIFARSLLNAALLGYLFGIAGVLAYTAYYLSFITGWLIVDKLRYVHGVNNIQSFFAQKFGKVGSLLFNILISLRLLTEVFANLLVVGLLFGQADSSAYNMAIIVLTVVTLFYSMNGGLSASLRTDVVQMVLLFVLILGLALTVFLHPQFDFVSLVQFKTQAGNKGWILLIVAFLQVLSYPLHDPVMMDRGFLADRKTTKYSFIYAFGLSAMLIFIFGVIGVFAGVNTGNDSDVLVALQHLLGMPATIVIALTLILSAASTLDSTFSSVSKLVVVDIGLGKPSVNKGRLAMLFFALGGIALVIWGSKDLFDAVAVSGTASLALTPVILFSIFIRRDVRVWSFVVNFILAFIAAGFYFLEKNNKTTIMHDFLGVQHGYDKLLIITVFVLICGILCFMLGLQKRKV